MLLSQLAKYRMAVLKIIQLATFSASESYLTVETGFVRIQEYVRVMADHRKRVCDE